MSTNPFSDPYQSPQYYSPPGVPQFPPGHKPPVWTWYVIYCVVLALIYFLCIVGGIAMLAASQMGNLKEEEQVMLVIQGIVLTIMGAVFCVLFGAAPFLPRSKFAWIYGFVTIGLGLTSCCILPFSVALLIYWLKPDLKAYLNAL